MLMRVKLQNVEVGEVINADDIFQKSRRNISGKVIKKNVFQSGSVSVLFDNGKDFYENGNFIVLVHRGGLDI